MLFPLSMKISTPYCQYLKTKLDPQSITKTLDGLSDILRARSGESSAEEHAFLAQSRSREPATARDENTVVNCSLENVLLDGLTGLSRCQTRMLLPVNLDPVLYAR